MKKHLVLGMSILCLVLTGCVQSELDTVIEKDGSGIFSLVFSMSSAVARSVLQTIRRRFRI